MRLLLPQATFFFSNLRWTCSKYEGGISENRVEMLVQNVSVWVWRKNRSSRVPDAVGVPYGFEGFRPELYLTFRWDF